MYAETVILGVILAIISAELLNTVPGGFLTAGVLAFHMTDWVYMAAAAATAALAWGAVTLLSRKLIIFGRRRMAVSVMIAFVLNVLISLIPGLGFSPDVLSCVVPGILVSYCERQGALKTLAYTLAAVLILFAARLCFS